MKLLTITTALLSLVVLPAVAKPVNASDIPSCTVPCLLSTLKEINCTIIDDGCMCSQAARMSQIMTPCLLQTCTMADTMAMSRLQATMCDMPPESRQRILTIVNFTALPLETLFISLRLGTRWMVQRTMCADDWLMLTVLAPCIVGTAMVAFTISKGLGLHLWQVDPDVIPSLLSGLIISEASYPIIVGMVRIALLIFFLRIFPRKSFQIFTKLLIVEMILHTIIFTLLIIFQCSPVAFGWDKTIHGGKCLNLKALAYAGAAFASAHDVLTLALPINELRHLNLSLTKKFGIIIMFIFGSCGCIASFIRLKMLSNFPTDISNDPDISWSSVDVTYWSEIEVASIIICACVPSLRALFQYATGLLTNKSTSKTDTNTSSIILKKRKHGNDSDVRYILESRNDKEAAAASTEMMTPAAISRNIKDDESI